MEKYKANKKNVSDNNFNNQENKQNAVEKGVDLAAETALDAFTAGKGSKIKNMAGKIPIVGNQVNKTWNNAVKNVSNVVSKTPVGDIMKKADQTGVTDTVKNAKNTLNGGKVSNINTSKSNNLLNSLSGLKKDNNKSGGNILTSTFDKLPISMKIKIIGIVSIAILILFLFILVFAEHDPINLALTNGAAYSGSKTKGGTRDCSSEEIEDRLIYVGDSRIVGMKGHLNKSNITFIAKSAMGHKWLVDTALPELDKVLSNKDDAIVVFAFGANDINNYDSYIKTYNDFMDKYSNVAVYIMSVNPVIDARTLYLDNDDILPFNKKMQEAFPDIYLDIHSLLVNIEGDQVDSEGLHYMSETNHKIHDNVLSMISKSNGVKCSSVSSGDLIAKLEEVGKWYIKNVNTYTCNTSGKFSNCRKNYKTPFADREYGDDCTEFAALYMAYVAGTDISAGYSGSMIEPNGEWAQEVEKTGWKAYSSDEIDSLKPGDVLIAHAGMLYSTKGKHAEIYISENQTFGWGSIKKSYPTSNSIKKTERGGHTHFEDSGHDYITIYRYEGESSSSSGPTTSLNVIKMFNDKFNHGTKPRQNQKYIMLHDTASSGNAKNTIEYWRSPSNPYDGTVAAHYVIDRDGTIVQAVDLDVIAHHAGWGGPGNFDQKFGVGNNDGKGNGDDLVGRTKLARYSSYGMNSYSVGIELCHVLGETYPIAQLEALDKVIAYIDSYFGKKSEIIDHKQWRPSNGDTDATKFATYLQNYKSKRTYK